MTTKIINASTMDNSSIPKKIVYVQSDIYLLLCECGLKVT